jgi:hypothetical protein
MFGNLGLHVLKNPAGTYSYVGSIPTALAEIVSADASAVMGGRAFRDEEGKTVMYKFPVFSTRAEAMDFAEAKGFDVISAIG